MSAIYYVFSKPPLTGGDFVSVEHVAALHRLGFNAKVFYAGDDNGSSRFQIPVVRSASTPIAPDDILVLGENQKSLFQQLRQLPCILVMHNQNPYWTFTGFSDVAEVNGFPFRFILVPSDFTAEKLRSMGVRHPLMRVHPAIPDYFKPAAKTFQIACAAAKREVEAEFIAGYFRSRVPSRADIPWIMLRQMRRQDCARVMGEAAIYVALPQWEGLGLMSLEAMASGCHVVGYTGGGGAEYARPENGDWIAEGDHDALVAALDAACARFSGGKASPMVAAGLTMAAHYSQANFESQLLEAWKSGLGEKAADYRR